MAEPQDPTPDGASPASAVLATLARADAEIAAVQAAPLPGHTDGEARQAVARVVALRAKLDAAYLHLLSDLDARPDAVPGPAAGRSAATFLVHACNVAPHRAAKDVRAAKALDPSGAGIIPGGVDADDPAATAGPEGLPRLAAALAEGAVSLAHVDAVVRCLRDVPQHLLQAVDDEGRTGLARVDAFLAEHARTVSPDTLARIGKHLVATLDPDGSDSYDPRSVDRRRRTTPPTRPACWSAHSLSTRSPAPTSGR